jgi:hypothetical protein
MTELQKMTDLERALLHIKTRADAWALKEVEKALSQEPTDKPTTAVSKKGCHNCKWADEIFCNLPNRHMKPCKNFSKWEQEPCDDAISREAVCNIVNDIRDCISVEGYWAILERLKKLPTVTQKSESVTEFADRCRECGARYGKLLKQKSGKCKNCKYFEYDSVAKVDGIPLIVAHEICNKWGGGCKTKEDGYCYMFEPQESEDKE